MATLITRAGNAAPLNANQHDENLKRETNPQSGNYTVAADDNRATVEYTGTGGHTITLPDASTLLASEDTGDFQVTIVNRSGNSSSVIIGRTGAGTINGAASNFTLYVNEAATFKCGSTTDDWMIVSQSFGGARDTVVFGTLDSGPTFGTTYYCTISGETSGFADEYRVRAVCPVGGTIYNLYTKANQNTANFSTTLTIRKNSSATSLTTTIPAGSTAVVSDTTNTVTFVAGDVLSLSVVGGAGSSGVVGGVNWSFCIRRTT